MAKMKPQFRRLVYIDQEIRKGARLNKLPNARTLADAYEVSQRTIQRDIDFLIYELNAPIKYDPQRYGYIYTDASFRLPALNISQGDFFAVTIAEKVLQQYRGTPLYDRLKIVFEKLQSSIPDNVTIDPSWLDERFTFFPDASPTLDPDIWELCLKGLQDSHTVTFDYLNPGYAKTYSRTVDPYHFVSYRAQWYLIGYCHYVKDIRVFAVSRMSKAKVTKEEFVIPADFEFETYAGTHFGIIFGSEEHEIRVLFNAETAPYVKEREWHWTQVVEEHDDGSMELTLRANHLLEISRWILSWGGGATVLEPPELVEMVADEVRRMSGVYG
jgi:predicted DNA-binding transcriptional regulator YafY